MNRRSSVELVDAREAAVLDGEPALGVRQVVLAGHRGPDPLLDLHRQQGQLLEQELRQIRPCEHARARSPEEGGGGHPARLLRSVELRERREVVAGPGHEGRAVPLGERHVPELGVPVELHQLAGLLGARESRRRPHAELRGVHAHQVVGPGGLRVGELDESPQGDRLEGVGIAGRERPGQDRVCLRVHKPEPVVGEALGERGEAPGQRLVTVRGMGGGSQLPGVARCRHAELVGPRETVVGPLIASCRSRRPREPVRASQGGHHGPAGEGRYRRGKDLAAAHPGGAACRAVGVRAD